jgi:hypothetical protein
LRQPALRQEHRLQIFSERPASGAICEVLAKRNARRLAFCYHHQQLG